MQQTRAQHLFFVAPEPGSGLYPTSADWMTVIVFLFVHCIQGRLPRLGLFRTAFLDEKQASREEGRERSRSKSETRWWMLPPWILSASSPPENEDGVSVKTWSSRKRLRHVDPGQVSKQLRFQFEAGTWCMTPIRKCLNGEGLHFLQVPSELNNWSIWNRVISVNKMKSLPLD